MEKTADIQNMGYALAASGYNYKQPNYFQKNMKRIAIASLIVGLCTLFIYMFLLFTNHYINFSGSLSLENGSKIAPFIGSVVGTLFTLAGTFLIFENLRVTRINHEQNELSIQKSQFESVFFNLLNQQRQIVTSIDTSYYSHKTDNYSPAKGFKFFDDFSAYIKNDFGKEKHKPFGIQELISLFNEQFNIHSSALGHYFRHMYHIARYVDENPFFEKIKGNKFFFQKTDYFRILRAQISNSEMVLLALNGLTKRGAGFKKYLVKYELLRNINFELNLPFHYQCHVPAPDLLAQEYPYLQEFLTEQKKDSGWAPAAHS